MNGWTKRIDPRWVLAITCLLGWAFKGHCGAYWLGDIQYLTGCYSDAVPFWGLRGVSAGQIPYLEARMEYPVLTGWLIWAEGLVTRTLFGSGATAAHFLFVVAAVNAGLAFLVLAMMRRARVDRTRQFAWAGAPPLVLYLGHNWDMLAVTFAVAAVLFARRGGLRIATALAALGSAAKLFPVLLLPVFGLAALFARGGGGVWRRVGAATVLAAIAIGSWGLVNAPIAVQAFANWSEFYTFSSARSGTAASVWEILAQAGWWVTPVPTRNLWSGLVFLGGAAMIVGLGWIRHRARPWLLFAPVLAWFLLTNKVYSPQFDLWLYPMLVLTSYRLWPVAWFALGDIAAYFAEFWWFAGIDGYHPAASSSDIAVAATFRAASMLWLIGSSLLRPAPAWVLCPRTAPDTA
ncbi:hypothetical protein [Sphingomonas sp. CARO-RG-8B-R24-01]|uniref:hypothetical protein n=1 Tax=Sphingomonas sp. CARO-RG-8B-R24-01 TaxID=2914831 RepID=UPI001F56685E|nr:hypothetical protein [Sphingomonas sp. CARO-RG-8B-R24-01]